MRTGPLGRTRLLVAPWLVLAMLLLVATTPCRVGHAQSAAPAGSAAAAPSGSAGPAEPAPDAAKRAAELKAQGDAAMQTMHFEDALQAYDQAYELEPSPALDYNRGRALQGLGRFPEALGRLEAFERSAPPDIKAKVPQLGQLLADVRSRVSTLGVSCNVAGARVHWKGVQIGLTPLAPTKLTAGTGTLEVLADGYLPFEQKLELAGTQQRTVTVDLQSKSTSGILRVKTDPPGASVSVDGKPIGQGPAEAIVRAGSHKVLVEADGYETAETEAVVTVGKTNPVDIQLGETPGIAQQWWFWTGLGVLVVGGVVITAVALSERGADSGDIPPGQVAAPLLGGQRPIAAPIGATLFQF
jgi:hypothetical protein